MSRRRNSAAAFISGLAGGMALGQKWKESSERSALRKDLADVSNVRETAVASGDEAQKAGMDAYNMALSAAATPEDRARVEQDYAPTLKALEAEMARPASVIQTFGTGRNFQQVADKAALPDAQIAAREGVYRRHGKDEEADRLQDRALNREAARLNIDTMKDAADGRAKLKRVDQELRAWGEKRFQFGEDGRPAIDDDGMVHLGKMRVLLLSREGLFDDAMKTAEQSMQYATRKIQAETAQRAAETDKALALFDRGDYGAAIKVYNMIPDGSRATGVVVGKDGSVSVPRESSVDGAKLPDARFKSLAELRASVEAMKDPNAVINHVQRTFKNDIETRRLNIAAAGDARAASKDARAEARDAEIAAASGVLFAEQNPNATSAQKRAVELGIIPAVPKDSAYKTEFNEVASALGTPAVDDKGKPITDLMTGRQVINRNPDAEAAFFKWAQGRGIKDTNKAIPIYLAEKGASGAQKPATEKEAHEQARAAIKAGKSRDAVNARLKQWGYSGVK